MKLYLITGKAETGKSTLGGFLKDHLKDKDYNACIMQITSTLYHYAEDYFFWDKKANEKPREFLQNLGIEIIREKQNKKDFLINRTIEDIEILSEFFDTFIITDIRFQEEIDKLKNKFKDVVVIKVERNNYNNSLTNKERNHITEKEVDRITNINYLVENTSLKELRQKAKYIIDTEEDDLII